MNPSSPALERWNRTLLLAPVLAVTMGVVLVFSGSLTAIVGGIAGAYAYPFLASHPGDSR